MTKPFPLPLFGHRHASLKDRLKLALGALVYPAQTRRWRDYIGEHPAFGALAHAYPQILHKIYRPYLSRQLGCAERVDVMLGHYRHIEQHGLAKLIVQAAAGPVTIAAFEGKDGSGFTVRLGAVNSGHREGELSLQLMHEDVSVYMASFAFVVRSGAAAIHLGAIQGLRAGDGAQVIKRVTKALHGWRPKQLMVALVRDLGDYLDCTTMHMVSNRNRVAINGRRSRRIASDYDAAWEEMHAVKRADGDYEIACVGTVDPTLASVPSHKRAEMRRRLALLDTACRAIRADLDARRRPPLRPLLVVARRASIPAALGSGAHAASAARMASQ